MKPLRAFLADKTWPCAVVAHRGAWSHGPENSCRALSAAADQGITFVELDVQESWDGVPFCLHDVRLDRVTAQTGAAAGRSWSELEPLTLRDGAGGDAPLTSERLARLDQALAVARGRIYLDIDVKVPRQMARVARAIVNAGAADHVNLKTELHCRADYDDLRALEALGVMVKPVIRIDRAPPCNMHGLIAEAGFPMVEVLSDDICALADLMAVARAAGTDVFVNTLDDVRACPCHDSDAIRDPDATWGRLIEMGVRLIQSDHPAHLQRYIDARA